MYSCSLLGALRAVRYCVAVCGAVLWVRVGGRRLVGGAPCAGEAVRWMRDQSQAWPMLVCCVCLLLLCVGVVLSGQLWCAQVAT